MSISEARAVSLPADSRGSRCGHNFEPNDCPYDGCLLRTQAARIAELNEECRNAKEWQEEFSKAADGRYERIAELEASVRNQQGDNLCWFDGSPPIPPKAEFLESCRRYHDQIATQNGVLEGGRTIAQLEARVVELEAERLPLYSDRIANLEAERDGLTAKVTHLYKLSELPFVSLGIVCEDRDRLKHSDRELRKCIAELEAERDGLRNALLNRCMQQELAERENAALRKTLEDAPCQKHCASNACREDREPLPSDWPVDWPEETFAPMITRVNLGLACNCRKSRIPEAG